MEEGGYGLLHEGVRLDEVDGDVRQRAAVLDAGARPGIRHPVGWHRQPVGVDSLLLLETAFERLDYIAHAERAYR